MFGLELGRQLLQFDHLRIIHRRDGHGFLLRPRLRRDGEAGGEEAGEEQFFDHVGEQTSPHEHAG